MSKIGNIIRNPKVIGQYAKGVAKAIRNKSNSFQLAFNREDDGGWYIDLPEWQGAHANLAMVAGADRLLEFVGCGDPRVEVEVIKSNKPIEEFEHGSEYFRCDQIDQSLVGGATYKVNLEGFGSTIWLCPVTLFVLGEYPKYLYVENIRARRADEGLSYALGLSLLQSDIPLWKETEEDYLAHPENYVDLTHYDENGKPYMMMPGENKFYMTNLGFDDYMFILENHSGYLWRKQDPIAVDYPYFSLDIQSDNISILMNAKKFVKPIG